MPRGVQGGRSIIGRKTVEVGVVARAARWRHPPEARKDIRDPDAAVRAEGQGAHEGDGWFFGMRKRIGHHAVTKNGDPLISETYPQRAVGSFEQRINARAQLFEPLQTGGSDARHLALSSADPQTEAA